MTEKTSNAMPASDPLLINPGFTSGTPIDIEAVRRMADDAGTGLVTICPTDAFGLPGEVPILINRKNGSASSIRSLIEEYREKPDRKKGTAIVNTLDSFVALTNRHKTGNSAIFADTDWRKPSLTTVVDYHERETGGLADNGKHRVHYPFPLSEEWQAWIAQDGKPMDQGDFAEWIEDHLPELAAPDPREAEHYLETFGLKVAAPNEMVALSRGLQIHVESRVKNNVVLQSGEGQITWDEEHRDAAGNRIIHPQHPALLHGHGDPHSGAPALPRRRNHQVVLQAPPPRRRHHRPDRGRPRPRRGHDRTPRLSRQAGNGWGRRRGLTGGKD